MKILQKIFQLAYCTVFLNSSLYFILGIHESKTMDKAMFIAMIISGILSYGKIIYLDMKGEWKR